jgi:hypothetical protein
MIEREGVGGRWRMEKVRPIAGASRDRKGEVPANGGNARGLGEESEAGHAT